MGNNLETGKQMVGKFVEEACRTLKMDLTSVRYIYVPVLHQTDKLVALLRDLSLVISEQTLEKCVDLSKPSIIRAEIYIHVHLIWQLSIQKREQPDMKEAMLFCSALGLTRNIPTPVPPGFAQMKEEIERELTKWFGFEAKLYPIPGHTYMGAQYYGARLTQTSEKSEIREWDLTPVSTVRTIDAAEKGSVTNPFDNIDEAFSYLTRLEKEAYQQDELLHRIEASDYFYDFGFHSFRVAWASPFTANLGKEVPTDGFIVNQNQVHPDGSFFFTLKPNLYQRKFLYRGQSRDYPKPCTPNLFRDETKTYFLDDLIWTQEMELLIKSHPLVRLLDGGIELLHDKFRFLMNLGGLAQHYYHKTTFLDFTSDIEAAKFFASTDYLSDEDRYVPVRDTSHLGMVYFYELQMPGAFSRLTDGCHLSVIGKQVFMRSGAQHGFLLDMPRGKDLKVHPLVRKIYFRHDPAAAQRIFDAADRGSKCFPDDALQTAWKNMYADRLKRGIVSADAVRLNVSRNKGETYDSIVAKLGDKVTVDNQTPAFPQELIDAYYQDIRNGWWQDFVCDIHFIGSDGPMYKKLLEEIPSQAEYRWAFVK